MRAGPIARRLASWRRSASIVVAVLLLSSACTADRVGRPVTAAGGPPAGGFEGMVCALPPAELVRIWRGYDPERSGDVQLVPREPNMLGSWLPHSGAWEHLQRVPLFLYGPGHVPAAGKVLRPATLADVAPTLAEHLRFPFRAMDGRALRAAAPTGLQAPRLVVVVVWDSVGRNVLAEHPDAWPTLRRLVRGGAWFERATVGSSPSVTPSIHATIGTGAYPRNHGLTDLGIRQDGEVSGTLTDGPDDLRIPTLADLYDRDRGGLPVVAVIASKVWHLPLLGHGDAFHRGDEDVAVLREDGRWGLPAEARDFFRFPRYVLGVRGLGRAVRAMDAGDGALDDAWMGEPLRGPGTVERTPAFAEHQTRVLAEVLRRERMGRDAVPDLLFVNYNEPDRVGHRWSMNSPQMEAVVRSSDRALGEIVRLLDAELGARRWVLVLTADHGSTPDPRTTGAVVIDNRRLQRDLEERFGGEGGPVVQKLRVTQMWMHTDRLERNGYTLEDVAAFLADYRRGDHDPDPDRLSEQERSERLFAAAFPSRVLEEAPCVPDA